MDQRLDDGYTYQSARMLMNASAEYQRREALTEVGAEWHIRSMVSSLSHVCREARLIADGSEDHELAFAADNATTCTRFNFEKDTLLILADYTVLPRRRYRAASPGLFLRLLSSDDLARVKHFAIEFITSTAKEAEWPWTEETYAENIVEVCGKLPNLNSLFIIESRPNVADLRPEELVLMDPIDIEATMAAYINYIASTSPDAVLPNVSYIESPWRVDGEYMKELVKEWKIDEERPFLWPKEISRKIVLSMRQLEEFALLRANVDKAALTRGQDP